MEIKHIGVVGCGQMGSGIVEVAAKAGFLVTVREINQELLTRGLDRIKKSMSRAVSRGKLSEEEMEAALGRITGTTEMTDLADCDMVIEAAIENMNLKKEIFQELDDLCRPEAILATNTSSLSVTEIAAVTDRTDRVMGVHFFNPVPVMKLVELVSTILTSPTTVATVRDVVEKMGKTPVMANDTPGFIVNRLLVPYIIDAIRAYEQGLGSREDIDTGMKLGAGHPMGPLELADYIGLDTMLYVAQIMYDEFGEARFAPPPLLKRMVAAGHLGRKSGKGFYDYTR